jgi:hypothetical protein
MPVTCAHSPAVAQRSDPMVCDYSLVTLVVDHITELQS